jgi:formiminotetrahydrofolate cyclodeaminase
MTGTGDSKSRARPEHDFAALPLGEFLAQSAARSPVPGGGAGCAVIGAIGAAFGAMAARYSEPKDGAPGDDAISNAIRVLDITRTALLDLAGADATAYAAFDRARKLPKSTSDEAAVRSHALERAAQDAALVPLQTMRTCVDALAALERVAPKLNPRLASDVGVCALALKAALRGSMLNVETNLTALPHDVAQPLRVEALELLDRGEWSAQAGLAEAKAALRGEKR